MKIAQRECLVHLTHASHSVTEGCYHSYCHRYPFASQTGSLWWDEEWATKICPHPSPWNLWKLPYMAKNGVGGQSLQMWLRILGWRDDPGFSRWTLHISTYILLRGKQREIWILTDEEKTVWPPRQRLEWCGHRPRNASSHRSRKKQRTDSPAELPRERGLISAQWHWLWPSGLQGENTFLTF